MRAEFYNHDGSPFLVAGRHATTTLDDPLEYLYIPCKRKNGEIVLYKFMRLAISDDHQVVLYAVTKTREYERGNA